MKRLLVLLLLPLVAASTLSLPEKVTAGESDVGELVVSPGSTTCVSDVSVESGNDFTVSGQAAARGKCICVEGACEEDYYEGGYSLSLALYASEGADVGEREIVFTLSYQDGSEEKLAERVSVEEREEEVEEEPVAEIRTTELILNQTWEMLHNMKIKLKSTEEHIEDLEEEGAVLPEEEEKLEELEGVYERMEEDYEEAVLFFNQSNYRAARERALSVQSEHYIYLSRIDDVEGEVELSLRKRNRAVESIEDVVDEVDLMILRVAQCEALGGCERMRARADSLEDQLNQSSAALREGRFSEAKAISEAAEINAWNLKMEADEEMSDLFSSMEELILGDLADIERKGEVAGASAPTLSSLTNTSGLSFDERRQTVCRAIPKVREAADKTTASLTSYRERKGELMGRLEEVRGTAEDGIEKANKENIEIDTSDCSSSLSRAVEMMKERNLYQASSVLEEAREECGEMKMEVESEVENRRRLSSVSLASRLGYFFERVKMTLGLSRRVRNRIALEESVVAEIESEEIGEISLNPAIASFEERACQEASMPRVRTVKVDVPSRVEDPGYRRVEVEMGIGKVHRPV